jgi:integrase
MRLTAASLGALKLDTGVADKIFFDDDVPGFGLRVRASGARTWVFQYKIGQRTRRLVLGNASAVKVAQAKQIAGELHAKVRLGGDPAAEKRQSVRRSQDTFDNLIECFLEQYKKRPRTRDEVVRHLKKYAAPLHSMPVDSIALRDIADLLTKLSKSSGPTTTNRVRSTLSAVFSWAMREGLAHSNPVTNTNKRDEHPRDRVLSNDELRRIWNAADDNSYGIIIKLLILTGQRRSEIGGLCWSEIDFSKCEVMLPAERTKNRRPHVVPLTRTSRELLEGLASRNNNSGRVFKAPKWGDRKNELDKRSGVSAWVVHDIRRSVATGMADIGIAPHIIEAVLNHVSGHKGGVAGIYNRSPYAAEKAAALLKWDEHVASVVRGGCDDG